MYMGDGVELVKVRGKKVWSRYLEAAIVALSRDEIKRVVIRAMGEASKTIFTIKKLVDEYLYPLKLYLFFRSPSGAEVTVARRSKSDKVILAPVYELEIEKKQGFSLESVRPDCPENYKCIRIKSGKKFTRYVTAVAMALSRGEGDGLCLDSAGLAIRNLGYVLMYMGKKPEVFGVLRPERVMFSSGVREWPSGRREVFGRLMVRFSISR